MHTLGSASPRRCLRPRRHRLLRLLDPRHTRPLHSHTGKKVGYIFTCGALAQRRSSSCPFHLLFLLPKFPNEFLMAQKAKFNMESYAIWVKNFKSEDRFDLRGHSEAQIADFNFTLKNPDGFLIFCHRVSIVKNTKTMA